MIPPIPQIVPMDLWGDLLGALNTMMHPLYLAVSWIMASFHTLYASFLGPDNGWSWALASTRPSALRFSRSTKSR